MLVEEVHQLHCYLLMLNQGLAACEITEAPIDESVKSIKLIRNRCEISEISRVTLKKLSDEIT